MFKGTGTAIITPFLDDFSIDYESLKKILDYQIDSGIDAIILMGTTGEAPVISDEERARLCDFTTEQVNGRCKVIIGTGTNNPEDVLMHNRSAKLYNADGLLIVNPYYNKGTQSSLVEHFKYIDGESELPIVIYNVPSRTGMNMLPETVVNIFESCENVVAVKEASGNISQIAELMSIRPKELTVLSGNDDQTLPLLALGGDGVVSVFSNAFPKEMIEIVKAVKNNNLTGAQEIQNTFLKIMNLFFNETSPIPIKYMMHKFGLCKNIVRLPLTVASQDTMNVIDAEFDKLKLQNKILSQLP